MRWATILGVLCAVGCGGASDDGSGVVKVEFKRGDATPPIAANSMVAVSLEYGECLLDYYETNPDARQDGVDGQAEFDDWLGRLCEPQSGFASCEVVSIEQNLEIQRPRLRVEYEIDGELEDRLLLVGPFPTSDTADCDNGLSATVRFGSVEGLTVETFNPSEAVVNQGAAISIAGG